MTIELATAAEHAAGLLGEVMPRKTWIARHVELAMRCPEVTNPFVEGTPPHAEWAACFDAAMRSDVLEGSEA